MDGFRVLKILAMSFIVPLGMLSIAVMISEVYKETRLFTDPKFKGFWEEAEGYKLNRDSKKSIMELSRRYGAVTVNNYIEDSGLASMFFPNEDAVFVSS